MSGSIYKIKLSQEMQGRNLLSNPSFDVGGTSGTFNSGAELDDGTSDDFVSWTESNNDVSGNKTEATATVRSGNAAVKLTRTDADAYVYVDVAVSEFEVYDLSFWTRGDGAQDLEYRVYDNTNAADIVARAGTGITGTTYTRFQKRFMIPEDCVSIRIYLYTAAVNSTVVYVDDVVLQERYTDELEVTSDSDGVYIISDGVRLEESILSVSLHVTCQGSQQGLMRIIHGLEKWFERARLHNFYYREGPVEVCLKLDDGVDFDPIIGRGWLRGHVMDGRVVPRRHYDLFAFSGAAEELIIEFSLRDNYLYGRTVPVAIANQFVRNDDDGGIYVEDEGYYIYSYDSNIMPAHSDGVYTLPGAVTMWWKPIHASNHGTDQYIFGFGTILAYFEESDDTIKLQDAGGGNVATTGALTFSAGAEMFLGFVWQDGELSLYVNGVQIDDAAAFTPSAISNLTLLCAAGAMDSGGRAYDVRVWDRPLTDVQIAALYVAGRGQSELPYMQFWGVPGGDLNSLSNVEDLDYYRHFFMRNGPGDMPAEMRLKIQPTVHDSEVTAGDIFIGLHHSALPHFRSDFEAEDSSTYYGSNTSTNADATASGGNSARKTSLSTSWSKIVDIVLAENIQEVNQLFGRWYILARVQDNAASPGTLFIRYRCWMSLMDQTYLADMPYTDAVASTDTGSWILMKSPTPIAIPPMPLMDEVFWGAIGNSDAEVKRLFLEVEVMRSSGSDSVDLDFITLLPAWRVGELNYWDDDASIAAVVYDGISRGGPFGHSSGLARWAEYPSAFVGYAGHKLEWSNAGDMIAVVAGRDRIDWTNPHAWKGVTDYDFYFDDIQAQIRPRFRYVR